MFECSYSFGKLSCEQNNTRCRSCGPNGVSKPYVTWSPSFCVLFFKGLQRNHVLLIRYGCFSFFCTDEQRHVPTVLKTNVNLPISPHAYPARMDFGSHKLVVMYVRDARCYLLPMTRMRFVSFLSLFYLSSFFPLLLFPPFPFLVVCCWPRTCYMSSHILKRWSWHLIPILRTSTLSPAGCCIELWSNCKPDCFNFAVRCWWCDHPYSYRLEGSSESIIFRFSRCWYSKICSERLSFRPFLISILLSVRSGQRETERGREKVKI